MTNNQYAVSEIIREAEKHLGDKFKENVFLGKQSLIKEFLGALVSCGELTEVNRERIEKNPALKEYFQQPIDMVIETDDSFVKGSIGDKLRMSGVEVVKYDYGGDMVLWNKDTQDLLDMDDGSYIGATMKCDHKGDWYPVPCDEGGQEGSDEEDSDEEDSDEEEPFEGRTTFPEGKSEETNEFIIRYIKDKYPECDVGNHGHAPYCHEEAGDKEIYKTGSDAKIILSGLKMRTKTTYRFSSAGETESYWDHDGFGHISYPVKHRHVTVIHNMILRGEKFEELDKVMKILYR